MTTAKKIFKVVWLCHFSNKEVRYHLSFSNPFFEKALRLLLKKPLKNTQRDFAAWVSHQIIEFEKFDDVELHVIAPHAAMKKLKQGFRINNINYHFYRPQGSGLWAKIKSSIIGVKETKFQRNRKIVKRFISEINPDIVDLIGAENPYYSICALDIDNRPLFLTCQTAYSSELFERRLTPSNAYNYYRKEIEIKIHQKVDYVGCEGVLHRNTVLKNNPEANVFRYNFSNKRPEEAALPKKYDFVFFAASLSKSKGVEDLIKALSIVVKTSTSVTLNIVGHCDPRYKKSLNNEIVQLGVEGNISFNDYFPEHADMYRHITQGRCAVLPIKLDEISSTILEAMMLYIPVITNRTTGTPFLNKDGECVLLSEIDNIQSLADNMLRVLGDDKYLRQLAINAKAFVDKEFDNTTSAFRLLSGYRAIIDHNNSGIHIPKELLFNINDFRIEE